MDYTQAFILAVNHAMIYEIGGFWDLDAPGAREGLIDTPEHRRACGYTNDPSDWGGETKYGISKKQNPTIDVTNLDWNGAKAIYYSHYWINSKCDKIPGRIAALHFDSSINNGQGTAAKFLQRAIGATDDGTIGPATLAILNTKDPITVCNSICDQRNNYYQAIVNNNPEQAKYLNGWLRRISEMRAFVTNPDTTF